MARIRISLPLAGASPRRTRAWRGWIGLVLLVCLSLALALRTPMPAMATGQPVAAQTGDWIEICGSHGPERVQVAPEAAPARPAEPHDCAQCDACLALMAGPTGLAPLTAPAPAPAPAARALTRPATSAPVPPHAVLWPETRGPPAAPVPTLAFASIAHLVSTHDNGRAPE